MMGMMGKVLLIRLDLAQPNFWKFRDESRESPERGERIREGPEARRKMRDLLYAVHNVC